MTISQGQQQQLQMLQKIQDDGGYNLVDSTADKKKPQGKLVRCIQGEILDVIIDIRTDSPTFGQYLSLKLNQENKKLVWIPHGLAHGFSVLSDTAEIIYKVTDFYSPQDEAGIRWNDPDLAIDWQVKNPQLSKRDQDLPLFQNIIRSFSQYT